MRFLAAIILIMMTFTSVHAYKYTYSFNNTPISEAIVRISNEHPDVNIFFIYNEINDYKTSAKIHTDDSYTALRHKNSR